MEVSGINKNYCAPAFGMVSLEKGASKFISKLSEFEQKSFTKAVEELSDTKFWDMAIDEFGCIVRSKMSGKEYRGFVPECKPILGELDIRAIDNKDVLKGLDHPKPRTITFCYDKDIEAMRVYKELSIHNDNMDDVGAAALVTRELEKKAANKEGMSILA